MIKATTEEMEKAILNGIESVIDQKHQQIKELEQQCADKARQAAELHREITKLEEMKDEVFSDSRNRW